MGAKGSGRKSRYEEIQRGNLLEVCTHWLVENFHTFDKDTKIKVALQIASRGIVQKVEANVSYSVESVLKTVKDAEKIAGNRIAEHVSSHG